MCLCSMWMDCPASILTPIVRTWRRCSSYRRASGIRRKDKIKKKLFSINATDNTVAFVWKPIMTRLLETCKGVKTGCAHAALGSAFAHVVCVLRKLQRSKLIIVLLTLSYWMNADLIWRVLLRQIWIQIMTSIREYLRILRHLPVLFTFHTMESTNSHSSMSKRQYRLSKEERLSNLL